MGEMNILVCISLQLRHHMIGGTEAGVVPERHECSQGVIRCQDILANTILEDVSL